MKKSLPKTKRQRRLPIGAYLLILVSLLALLLTTWRFFAPLSGVTGTAGALLAMFGAFMLALAGLILSILNKKHWRVLLLILSWIGAFGTLLALILLHGYLSAFFIAIGFVALLYESFAFDLRRAL